MSASFNGVVTDLSRHPQIDYAVIWEGLLLPIRFSSPGAASDHLFGLHGGAVIVNPRLPSNIAAGRSLREGEAA